jgi:protein ImuB
LVAAVNDLARQAGVIPGMDRRQAEGLCPAALSLDRDLGTESARFEAALGIVEDLIPRVEIVEPGWLFVPIAGAVAYYGGEDVLVERVAKELDRVAPGVRLGVADGPFAAQWAARTTDSTLVIDHDADFLAGLDVSTIDHDDMVATFRWLGVTTLGQLAALPRETIASRFGSPGLAAHRLASGEDRIPSPRDIPPDLDAEGRYEEPLQLLDQLGFAARAVAGQLLEALRPHGIAPHRVEIEAQAADGSVRSRVWRSADPFDEHSLADRVWWQLRAWIESAGIPGGLLHLRLAPADLTDEGRQLALFEDVAARVEAERAVARAQAILGPDAVLEARPQGGRDPQDRVRWSRWGDDHPPLERDLQAPWPGRLPDPAPTLIPPEPKRLDVEWEGGMPTRVRLGSRWEPVLSWAGPWRRVGRWWRDEPTSDVYQIVTSPAAMLCHVIDGQTYMVGVYD